MSLPEVTVPAEKKRLLPEAAWLDLAALLFLGALFLSPILISPHFGMFSDYGQILGWPDRNIHSAKDFLREFRPLADGRWTPMFHVVTFGLVHFTGAFGVRVLLGTGADARGFAGHRLPA